MGSFAVLRRIDDDERTRHLFVVFRCWRAVECCGVAPRRYPLRAPWARPNRPLARRAGRNTDWLRRIGRSQGLQTRRGAIWLSGQPKLRRGISRLVRRGGLPAGAPYRIGLLGWALHCRGAGIVGRLDFGLVSSISNIEREAARSNGLRDCRRFRANLRSDSGRRRGGINLCPGWDPTSAIGSQRRWTRDWA